MQNGELVDGHLSVFLFRLELLLSRHFFASLQHQLALERRELFSGDEFVTTLAENLPIVEQQWENVDCQIVE